MSDIADLCVLAAQAATRDEEVEAYAADSRRTQIRARQGEVESLTFAETRGLGVRVLVGGRLGYAYAADPEPEEMPRLVAKARASASFSQPDEANVLPALGPVEPLPGIYREEQEGVDAPRKVVVAIELERAAVGLHPEVRKVESASLGDSSSRVAIASTRGGPVEFARTDCWASVSALAERGGETQSGFGFRLAHRMDDLEWEAAAGEAVDRSARLLGGTKPATERVRVVLDPVAAVSFLGVLAANLSAEAAQKGRSPLAGMLGEQVASSSVSIVDDGRLLDGPAAAPFDDEGVTTGRTGLIDAGGLRGFLHNTYTAARAKERSTGNAGRASYRTAPGVSPSNLFLEPADGSVAALLARAGRAVYVQEVSGLHSGANPISGEFSVGAVGLRLEGGSLDAPLREMTVASTLFELLRSIVVVGPDLKFFPGGLGAPTLLIEEMTVAGV